MQRTETLVPQVERKKHTHQHIAERVLISPFVYYFAIIIVVRVIHVMRSLGRGWVVRFLFFFSSINCGGEWSVIGSEKVMIPWDNMDDISEVRGFRGIVMVMIKLDYESEWLDVFCLSFLIALSTTINYILNQLSNNKKKVFILYGFSTKLFAKKLQELIPFKQLVINYV